MTSIADERNHLILALSAGIITPKQEPKLAELPMRLKTQKA